MNRSIIAMACLFPLNLTAGDWTDTDTKWQLSYLAIHATDWRQTIVIGKLPGAEHAEDNNLLGMYPSRQRVNSYFALTAIAHTAVSYYLPPDWRRAWQLITIGIEAGTVRHNYHAGVRIDF